jgi:hypothetical protein
LVPVLNDEEKLAPLSWAMNVFNASYAGFFVPSSLFKPVHSQNGTVFGAVSIIIQAPITWSR